MTFDEILTAALSLSFSEQAHLIELLERSIRDAVTSEVRPLSDDKDTLEIAQLTDDSLGDAG